MSIVPCTNTRVNTNIILSDILPYIMLMLVFIFFLLVELLIVQNKLAWKLRRYLSVIVAVGLAFWLGVYVFSIQHNIFSVVLVFIIGFRLLNLLKIAKGTIHPDYLYRVSQRSIATLSLMSLGIYLLATSSYIVNYNVDWAQS